MDKLIFCRPFLWVLLSYKLSVVQRNGKGVKLFSSWDIFVFYVHMPTFPDNVLLPDDSWLFLQNSCLFVCLEALFGSLRYFERPSHHIVQHFKNVLILPFPSLVNSLRRLLFINRRKNFKKQCHCLDKPTWPGHWKFIRMHNTPDSGLAGPQGLSWVLQRKWTWLGQGDL